MRAMLVVLGAMLLTACDRPAADLAGAERDLRAANAAYDQALINGDAAALDKYYHADFHIIDDDGGVHSKQNQIEFMTKRVDLLHAKGDEIRVKMLGPDAALLTGRFSGRYSMDGKEADFTERFTSVWVREGGQWQVRHEHTSMVPVQPTTAS